MAKKKAAAKSVAAPKWFAALTKKQQANLKTLSKLVKPKDNCERPSVVKVPAAKAWRVTFKG